LKRIGLRFQEIELDGFQPAVTSVALGVLTEEVMFDADILRRLMTDRLRGLHVDTRVASEVIHIERHGDGFEVSTTDGDKRSFAAVVN
jgi:L-2-hydroxyglutarate oxidase LhgO